MGLKNKRIVNSDKLHRWVNKQVLGEWGDLAFVVFTSKTNKTSDDTCGCWHVDVEESWTLRQVVYRPWNINHLPTYRDLFVYLKPNLLVIDLCTFVYRGCSFPLLFISTPHFPFLSSLAFPRNVPKLSFGYWVCLRTSCLFVCLLVWLSSFSFVY